MARISLATIRPVVEIMSLYFLRLSECSLNGREGFRNYVLKTPSLD